MNDSNSKKRESVGEILRRTALQFAEARTREYILRLESVLSASECLVENAAMEKNICQIPQEQVEQVRQAIALLKKSEESHLKQS
jgi:hypothetical protein